MQIEQKLSIFKRNVQQKIFGLNKQADYFCRSKSNEELGKLTKRKI
jgi:hypothetical protein